MSARGSVIGLVVAGMVVAVVLATLVSPFASSSPDVLEKVAAENSLDAGVEEHAVAGGPLAGYGVVGVDHERAATGLAGVLGVAVTFGLGVGVFAFVRAVSRGRDARCDPERAGS